MVNRSVYLVAGLGATGYSIAAYLRRRNKPFVVYDTRHSLPNLDEFNLQFPGVEVFLGDLPTTIYPQLKAIIASPGVALDSPFLQQALDLDIPIYGDIECLAQVLNETPVIAITGTNGKSTVTSLVGEMAKAAGFSVAVAGNIGQPVLNLLDDEHAYDLWVLELSSFQLDLTHSLAPTAATILNISPDHLDRHSNFDAYKKAKHRIYNQASICLFNRQDIETIPSENHHNAQAELKSYGLSEPLEGQWGLKERSGEFYIAHGTALLMPVLNLRLKGKHNWENALAACALATAVGIGQEVIVKVLETFEGLPHRCQWIRTLNGVDWINDSKGTNVGAAISAISGLGSAMKGKIILIAGGLGKGADFLPLRKPVNDFVRSVVLIGKDADKIEAALLDTVPITRSLTLESAITLAKDQALEGDAVLLSPACASFDMFRDFNHRGESFANVVRNL